MLVIFVSVVFSALMLLGGTKGTRPVKAAGVVICLMPLSLASVKSELVLPFWYRLTRVSPGQRAVKRLCV